MNEQVAINMEYVFRVFHKLRDELPHLAAPSYKDHADVALINYCDKLRAELAELRAQVSESHRSAADFAANNAIRSWAILVKDYNATDEGGIVEVGIAGTRGTRIGFEWSTPEEWCDAVSSALLAANKENKT